MTWEETINYIRTKEKFKDLVKLAYLDKDLVLNVERYKSSVEYQEIIHILKKYLPKGKKILDIGSGNGITAISFAIDGYDVVAVEPNNSKTIGAGAIKQLKEYYNLKNIEINTDFAENIIFKDEIFDIVFARQAMHHANNLKKFVSEMARVLKPQGVFLTVRDHVIYDEQDKIWFLENHPLQKFYGGENAYKSREYKEAIKNAGLKLKKELNYFDSPINYFPESNPLDKYKNHLKSKIGKLIKIPFVLDLYYLYLRRKNIFPLENDVPGRMYSYIALK